MAAARSSMPRMVTNTDFTSCTVSELVTSMRLSL